MQDIDDLLRYWEHEGRVRGGDEMDAIMQAAESAGWFHEGHFSMDVIHRSLQERMDAQKADQTSTDRRTPQKGTVRWYQANADEMIARGSVVSVREAAFCLASIKLGGGMTVQSFDTICRLLASGGLLSPEENIMPR